MSSLGAGVQFRRPWKGPQAGMRSTRLNSSGTITAPTRRMWRCPYRFGATTLLLRARGGGGGGWGCALPSTRARLLGGVERYKGCPYRLASSRRSGPWEGAHKGCPYRLSSLGVLPWEGHPQGVPLPIVFSRRFALRRAPTRGIGPYRIVFSRTFSPRRAPTRGAPTDCLFSARNRPSAKDAHKRICVRPTDCLSRRLALGRAPTRGAPTDCLLSAA